MYFQSADNSSTRFSTLTSLMAPALPYLVEDIYSTLHEGDEAVLRPSVFAKKWAPSCTLVVRAFKIIIAATKLT